MILNHCCHLRLNTGVMITVPVAGSWYNRSRSDYLEAKILLHYRKSGEQVFTQFLHRFVIKTLRVGCTFFVSHEYLVDYGDVKPPVVILAKCAINERVGE